MSKVTKRIILAVGLIAVIVVLVILGQLHPQLVTNIIASVQDYRHYLLAIRHLGPFAFLAFGIVVFAVALIPGAPTSAVALLVGACLGHWLGMGVNAVGLTLGNLLQARLLGRFTENRDQRKTSWVYQKLTKMRRPQIGLTLGYAVPMIPTMVINMASNDVAVSNSQRFTACLVGSVVASAIYAFSGDLLLLGQYWKTLLILIGIAAVIALAEVGLRDRRTKRSVSL